MCGIFGVIPVHATTQAHVAFLDNALVCGQVRGAHGTGMFVVESDWKLKSHKAAVQGADFTFSKAGDQIMRDAGGAYAVVGHHRFKTSGDHVHDHCHPFAYGSIIGVHNGGIPPWILRTVGADQHEVDSARLYSAIAKAEKPSDVLSKIDSGAYALVWYDQETQCIYMARNDQRPLHVIKSNKGGIMFASEPWMLSGLAARHNLYEKGDKIALLDPWTLYTFPVYDLDKTESHEYGKPKIPVYTHYNTRQRYLPSHERGMYDGTFDMYGDDVTDVDWWGKTNKDVPARDLVVECPSKVFFSLTALGRSHPKSIPLTKEIENALVVVAQEKDPFLNVMVLDTSYNIAGLDGFAGIVVSPDSPTVHQNLPVFVRAMGEAKDAIANLIPKNHDENTKYSVISIPVDKYRLTADGVIIAECMPYKIPKPVREIINTDESVVISAMLSVEGEHLKYLTKESLSKIWQGEPVKSN